MLTSFEDILAQGLDDERLVRRVLALYEHAIRRDALFLLHTWLSLGLRHPASAELAALLQRPSFGSWHTVRLQLRRARRQILTDSASPFHETLVTDAILAAGLAKLDFPLEGERLLAYAAVIELLGQPQRDRPRIQDEVGVLVSLRNRIAHDQPAAPEWWARASHALRRLAAVLPPVSHAPLPKPWGLERDGRSWTFAGLRAGQGRYLDTAGQVIEDADLGHDVMAALGELTGLGDPDGAKLRRLLARVPETQQGVLLGDVIVGEQVGAGGFATVHLGHRLGTGRRVAVKILHDGLSEEVRTRFAREAEYLSRFDHPGVVRVYQSGEAAWRRVGRHTPDAPWFRRFQSGARVCQYLVMEWVEGETLEQIYQLPGSERPDEATLADWLRQAAEALGAVHDAGLIHRDIKPGNLMVDLTGRIRLMDFGIARHLDGAETTLTAVDAAPGTVAYMSPEQLRANRAETEVGPAADMYGLCATFFELLYRSRVFDHDSTSREIVTARKLAARRPPQPLGHRASARTDLERLVLGGLEPDPLDRPQSMESLVEDLVAIASHRPLAYRPPTPWRRTVLAVRRRPRFAAAAAAGLLLVVGGLVVVNQRLSAERERSERAERQTQLERSLRLADQAAEALDSDRYGAAELFALQALEHADDAGYDLPDTRGLLVRVRSGPRAALRGGALLEPARPRKNLDRSRDELVLAALSTTGGGWLAATLEPDPNLLKATRNDALHLYLLGHDASVQRSSLDLKEATKLAVDPESGWIAIGSHLGSVEVRDAAGMVVARSLDTVVPAYGLALAEGREPPTVAAVVPGSPAAAAGFSPGDIVLAIAAQRTDAMSASEAQARMREGARQGRPVELAVQQRLEPRPQTFTLPPAPMDVTAVRTEAGRIYLRSVTAVAFGQDREKLVYGRRDGQMVVEWLGAHTRTTWEAFASDVEAVASFTVRDGRVAVASDSDGTLAAWHLEMPGAEPEPMWTRSNEATTRELLAIDGGAQLISRSGKALRVHDVDTGEVLATWQPALGHLQALSDAAASSSGSRVAVGAGDQAWVLALPGLRELVQVDVSGAEIDNVALSEDGSRLAIRTADALRFYDLDLADRPATLGEGEDALDLRTASLSSNAAVVVTADRQEFRQRLWTAKDDWAVGVSLDPPLWPVSLSANGEVLARCGARAEGVRVEATADPAPPNQVLRSPLRLSQARGCAISPDGELVAELDDQDLGLWDARSGEEVARVARPPSLDRDQTPGVIFLPDRRLVIYGDSAAVLSVPDRKWHELGRPDNGEHLPRWWQAAGARTADVVALLDNNGRIVVWDHGERHHGPWETATDLSAAELALSPDGSRLVALGSPRSRPREEIPRVDAWRVWELATGRTLAAHQEDHELVSAPVFLDEERFAVATRPGQVLSRSLEHSPLRLGLALSGDHALADLEHLVPAEAEDCRSGGAEACARLGWAAMSLSERAIPSERRGLWRDVAVQPLTRACEGGSAEACWSLGTQRAEQEHGDMALTALEAACTPTHPHGCKDLWQHALQTARTDLALSAARTGCTSDPGIAGLCHYAGRWALTPQQGQSDLNEARRLLVAGCEVGGHVDDCTTLGLVELEQGDETAALSHLAKACRELDRLGLGSAAEACGLLSVLWRQPTGLEPRPDLALDLADAVCSSVNPGAMPETCNHSGWVHWGRGEDAFARQSYARGCQHGAGIACYNLAMLEILEQTSTDPVPLLAHGCGAGFVPACLAQRALDPTAPSPSVDHIQTTRTDYCDAGDGEGCIWLARFLDSSGEPAEVSALLTRGLQALDEACEKGDAASCRLRPWARSVKSQGER